MRFAAFIRSFFHRDEDPSLKQRIKALEDRWAIIENEWTEWYEKFRLLHLRLAKRQKAIEETENRAQPQDSAPDTVPANGGLPQSGSLSDQQKDWQQKILRQRARM